VRRTFYGTGATPTGASHLSARCPIGAPKSGRTETSKAATATEPALRANAADGWSEDARVSLYLRTKLSIRTGASIDNARAEGATLAYGTPFLCTVTAWAQFRRLPTLCFNAALAGGLGSALTRARQPAARVMGCSAAFVRPILSGATVARARARIASPMATPPHARELLSVHAGFKYSEMPLCLGLGLVARLAI